MCHLIATLSHGATHVYSEAWAAQAMSSKSGRRSPRAQRDVYRKIHGCALELLAKLGHSYVISTLSREPLYSISEDREVLCKEGEPTEPCNPHGCLIPRRTRFHEDEPRPPFFHSAHLITVLTLALGICVTL